MYSYICIYIYTHARTHTHTNIYIYIYTSNFLHIHTRICFLNMAQTNLIIGNEIIEKDIKKQLFSY